MLTFLDLFKCKGAARYTGNIGGISGQNKMLQSASVWILFMLYRKTMSSMF
jgi:hypothetical protein